MYYYFRVVDLLHPNILLGFNWFQSVNANIYWVNCGFTLQNDFIAASVLIHCNNKVELYSFNALIYLLRANELTNNWFTFFSMYLDLRG